MNYTIVWNKSKTQGIILSGEEVDRDVTKAITGDSNGIYSTIAGGFYKAYGKYSDCTSVSLSEPTQEMIEAGIEMLHQCDPALMDEEDTLITIYKAMIQKLTCNL